MMKLSFLISLLICCYIKYTTATLVDGIVTLSWTRAGTSPVVDRFLSSDTQILLRLLCREQSTNTNQTQAQIRKSLNKNYDKTKILINGRIGRIVGCLPLQSESFLTASKTSSKDGVDANSMFQRIYQDLWSEMEIRTFTMESAFCEYDGELSVDKYTPMTGPEISPEKAFERRQKLLAQQQQDQPSKIGSQKSFCFLF